MATRADLADKPRDELYKLATDADLDGRSSMSKDELVDALADDAPLTGPADTDDPSVHVSSVTPPKADEALSGRVTAPATVTVPRHATPPRDDSNDRFETYTLTRPNGTTATLRRNIETGERTIDGDDAA